MKIFLTNVLLCCAVTANALPSLRIVGGDSVPDGKYPYQAAIVETFSGIIKCSGAIISDQWILTAAHCMNEYDVVDDDYYIVLGTTFINRTIISTHSHRINDVYPYEEFGKSVSKDDIALVQLKTKIQFNDNVKPIQLPENGFDKINYKAVSTGWGELQKGGKSSEKLQEIELTIIDNKKCRDLWEKRVKYEGPKLIPPPTIYDSYICTLNKVGEGTCKGDSGGPLVADGVLIGIVTFGEPCAVGFPDVFTRVSHYVDWIKQTMAEYKDDIVNWN